MAVEQKTELASIEISNNGVIHVVTQESFVVDGVVKSSNQHRQGLAPGDDVSNQPDQVKAVCAAIWTPDVIAAYQSNVEG
jgi:hypothetical protein